MGDIATGCWVVKALASEATQVADLDVFSDITKSN